MGFRANLAGGKVSQRGQRLDFLKNIRNIRSVQVLKRRRFYMSSPSRTFWAARPLVTPRSIASFSI